MEVGAYPGQVHRVGGALQEVTTSAGCYTSARSLHTPAAVSGLILMPFASDSTMCMLPECAVCPRLRLSMTDHIAPCPSLA